MQTPLCVEPARLGSLADELETSAGKIDKVLDQLQDEVRGVIDSWSGEAQLSYYRTQTDWIRIMTDLKGILDDVCDVAEESSDKYTASDSKIAGTFNF
jgi:WXG100 family type VII secretion target